MSNCSDTPEERNKRKAKNPLQHPRSLGKGTTWGKKKPDAGGGQKKDKK